MASGFGYTGGPSRCFPFWQEFAKCYAQADFPNQCKAQKEDYVECLHHTQEKARAKALRHELQTQQAHQAHVGKQEADIKATSAPIGVGLIKPLPEES
ncbi:hypothetical protein DACRYDRAFT_116070 [Dacryopinax primogenitus]|uniref:NADH dehydrogenase [ubiquinone] iron-sulfur protein 5 n=1 Tax=Dacryopinax primogenitus (strain DJM 731) TaxID=1858805 RepID=M5G0T8_DACPD|nr:uncharacterized protein DACRYDRAFT_116070 [Dacryopinax primogenitus]EJU02359.1 hypothetical protein DACRYDRAFT_116070 [Dacryopinax primogenitus]